MKTINSIRARLVLLAGISTILSTANAATLVLDDFSAGAFALQFDRPSDILQDIPTPLTDRRYVFGSGVKDWHATLVTSSGVMAYTLNLRGDPTDKSNYLDLEYRRRSGGFSILGNEAFSLSITNLVGRGEVMAYVGSSTEGIPMPITGTGEMVIPYAKLNSTIALGEINHLNFRLIGLSSDFSVTLDRITLVPEPGSLGLFAGGMAVLFATRRRRRADEPRYSSAKAA